MSLVLVVNSGSSSFKYQLLDMTEESVRASGLVERIGEDSGTLTHTAGGSEPVTQEMTIADHKAGFAAMLQAFADHGPDLESLPPIAVGHRVVQGGKRFYEATVITDLVKINIQDLAELAPLHNPANLQGIEAAQKAFPDVPHVAVFDTAFHRTLPPAAYTYAIDADVADKYRVRRYGAHGTSHKFVSEETARFLGRPLHELRTIVLHLGNGASACAVQGGRSVETSMGMTPLEGLVMGTRSGDIDPGAVIQLARRGGMRTEELDTLLNRKSGLLGLTGRGDLRDVQKGADEGDERCQIALDVYAHRVRQYVGSYMAQLGGVDAIVFTAGVGENDMRMRERILTGLDGFGISIDPDRNEALSKHPRIISPEDAPVTVLVIPTNEELEIARQALAVV